MRTLLPGNPLAQRAYDDPFSFFAVEVPGCPYQRFPAGAGFRVIEGPMIGNGRFQSRRVKRDRAWHRGIRRTFWTHFLQRFPSGSTWSGQQRSSQWRNRYQRLHRRSVPVAGRVGVFIRGGGARRTLIGNSSCACAIPGASNRVLGEPINGDNFFHQRQFVVDTNDRANWDRMSDWLHEQAGQIMPRSLRDVVEEITDGQRFLESLRRQKVETLTHDKAARKNIPTARYQSVAERMEEQNRSELVASQTPTHWRRGPRREMRTLDPRSSGTAPAYDCPKEQARKAVDAREVEIGVRATGCGRGTAGLVRSHCADAAALHSGEDPPKAIIDDLKRRTKQAREADNAPESAPPISAG